MQSNATTVKEYLEELPDDRRKAISAVRAVILKNLPKGYEEGMQYGMIGYYVPHSIYPPGYHCDPKQPLPYASLASQKNYMAVYMMCIYGRPEISEWFRNECAKTGKKLDMGKSCVRFRKLEDLPLPLIGKGIKKVSVRNLIKYYEESLQGTQTRKRSITKKEETAPKKSVKKKKK